METFGRALYLGASKPAKPLAPGSSKFWGFPDLPEDFEFPVDSEEFELEYICQINCADLAPFDTENRLPHHGLLVFFANIAAYLGCEDAEKREGLQLPQDTCAVYFDVEPETLLQAELVDEEGTPLGYPELKMTFSETENSGHQLFGLPELAPEAGTPGLNGHRLLFQLDAFPGTAVPLDFEGGLLLFLLTEDDLKARRFENTAGWIAKP